MSPLLNSCLAVIFLLLGAGAVIVMLELKGNPKDRPINAIFVRLHRMLGYGFVVLYLFMTVLMIRKAGTYQEEFSVRVVFHVALGLVLVPLAAVKVLVARRQKALTQHLPALGVALISVAFVLSGLTAGHYLLHQSDLRYITITAIDESVLDPDIGRAVMFAKCGKCHTFERVFRAFNDKEGWTKTVNRMAVIDAPNINDFDVKQVIFFLTEQQKQREEKMGLEEAEQIGKTLVSRKCSLCHDLDRVFKATKTKNQWLQTVEEMVAYSEDDGFLSENEKENIINYLADRKRQAAKAP